ncbi:MAG: DUF362 domain-containing protein [Candidatus Krumholzibacteriota bacterium]|nr:DUF362 domain-containing protein [Candidatus Krumholzibacteriota bacterium]
MKKHTAYFTPDETVLSYYLTRRMRDVFSEGDRVIVKLHMGEPGNRHHIASGFAARVVAALTGAGCEAVVFDTPVVYRSPRSETASYLAAAAEHGFTREAIGAPIVVSDRSEAVDGTHMTYELALDPIEADGVLLLTHVKGHMCCGMGGAIKNVGMGCMSKKTKGAIHAGAEPSYTGGCTSCGTCVENCPTGNIRLVDGEPRFDVTWCPGCSNCVNVCPAACIEAKTAEFNTLLAEAAVLAHRRYRKTFALNVIRGITKLCDCVADAGPLLADDVGYVCADDMLTADVASLALIREHTGRNDLFLEHNLISPWRHVEAAARMMGRTTDVDVETID